MNFPSVTSTQLLNNVHAYNNTPNCSYLFQKILPPVVMPFNWISFPGNGIWDNLTNAGLTTTTTTTSITSPVMNIPTQIIRSPPPPTNKRSYEKFESDREPQENTDMTNTPDKSRNFTSSVNLTPSSYQRPQKKTKKLEDILLYEHPFCTTLEYLADLWHIMMASGNVMHTYLYSISQGSSNFNQRTEDGFQNEPFAFAVIKTCDWSPNTNEAWRFEAYCCDLSCTEKEDFYRCIRKLVQTTAFQSTWKWETIEEFFNDEFDKSILMYCPHLTYKQNQEFEERLNKHWFFSKFNTPLIPTSEKLVKKLLASQYFFPGLYNSNNNFSDSKTASDRVGNQAASIIKTEKNPLVHISNYVVCMWGKDYDRHTRHLLGPTLFKLTAECKNFLVHLALDETKYIEQSTESIFPKGYEVGVDFSYTVGMNAEQCQWLEALIFDMLSPNLITSLNRDIPCESPVRKESILKYLTHKENSVFARMGKIKEIMRIVTTDESKRSGLSKPDLENLDLLYQFKKARGFAAQYMLPIFKSILKSSPGQIYERFYRSIKIDLKNPLPFIPDNHNITDQNGLFVKYQSELSKTQFSIKNDKIHGLHTSKNNTDSKDSGNSNDSLSKLTQKCSVTGFEFKPQKIQTPQINDEKSSAILGLGIRILPQYNLYQERAVNANNIQFKDRAIYLQRFPIFQMLKWVDPRKIVSSYPDLSWDCESRFLGFEVDRTAKSNFFGSEFTNINWNVCDPGKNKHKTHTESDFIDLNQIFDDNYTKEFLDYRDNFNADFPCFTLGQADDSYNEDFFSSFESPSSNLEDSDWSGMCDLTLD